MTLALDSPHRPAHFAGEAQIELRRTLLPFLIKSCKSQRRFHATVRILNKKTTLIWKLTWVQTLEGILHWVSYYGYCYNDEVNFE